MKPFLKWAGNKYRIIERIRALLPHGRCLIEPFAGSAAVFLNTDYERYLLADSNPDLINLYRMLQQEGSSFIDECSGLFTGRHNTPAIYYRHRKEFNNTTDPVRKASLFVYLNRHCYNGLCRYNSRGGYNVPFGRYVRPYFPAAEMLAFHHKAQYAEFRHQDYEKVMSEAQSGDIVYCDPPYVPLSRSASFTSYCAGGFDLNRQRRLAEIALQIADRGIPVLISNHNTPFTRRAYAGATRLRKFHVRRFISCNGSKRQHAGELLALFGPECADSGESFQERVSDKPSGNSSGASSSSALR